MKPNLKKHLPPGPLFPGLSFTPDFSTSRSPAAQGDGQWGFQ